jgi:hypothetical protein
MYFLRYYLHKKGKAAGIDNISAEILQVDPHLRAEMLYPLFLDMEGRKIS